MNKNKRRDGVISLEEAKNLLPQVQSPEEQMIREQELGDIEAEVREATRNILRTLAAKK